MARFPPLGRLRLPGGVHAVTRAIGAAYRDALGQCADVPPIDLPLAQRQHAAYVAALAELGAAVTTLPEGGFADGCFVEDTAIVVGRAALVTRPGAPSRRPETAAVARALGDLGLRLTTMEAPATLDGGDVLRLGDRLLVGRSERTNAEGIAALERFGAEVGLEIVTLDVPKDTLHLKCHATAPLPGLVVVARDVLPPALVPAGWRIVKIPDEEAYAANTVGMGDTVLVAAGYPETAARIAAAGARVRALDTTEIGKAAGSLTCLSLIVPAA